MELLQWTFSPDCWYKTTQLPDLVLQTSSIVQCNLSVWSVRSHRRARQSLCRVRTTGVACTVSTCVLHTVLYLMCTLQLYCRDTVIDVSCETRSERERRLYGVIVKNVRIVASVVRSYVVVV